MAAKADVEVAEVELGVGDVDAGALHGLVVALDVVLGNDAVVCSSDQAHADSGGGQGAVSLGDVGRRVAAVAAAV